MRENIEQDFQAAEFLQYEASELQLVDILGQASFLDGPRSLKEYPVVGPIEKERQRIEQGAWGRVGWSRAPGWTALPGRQEGPGTVSAKC